MRLPMGVNTKKGKGRFAVRLVKVDVTRGIDPDTIPRVHRAREPAKPSQGRLRRGCIDIRGNGRDPP